MTTNPEYITEVSGISYGQNTDNMTRSKGEDKAKAKSQAKMALNYKALSKI